MDQRRPFDAWRFNCVDYVLLALKPVLGAKLDAREPVLVRRAATPNRLYRALRSLTGVEVLKNADQLTQGSFWDERVAPTFWPTKERKRL